MWPWLNVNDLRTNGPWPTRQRLTPPDGCHSVSCPRPQSKRTANTCFSNGNFGNVVLGYPQAVGLLWVRLDALFPNMCSEWCVNTIQLCGCLARINHLAL